jgi:hypothetical protein
MKVWFRQHGRRNFLLGILYKKEIYPTSLPSEKSRGDDLDRIPNILNED